MQRGWTALALWSAGVLMGCATIDASTRDRTALTGEVPDSLGRILEVQIVGEGDADLRNVRAVVPEGESGFTVR